MAPRGVKKKSQMGKAILPPLCQSSAKAWAGVADSEFDLRILCKGKCLGIVFVAFVANQILGGELLLCHRAILASASSFLKALLQGHRVRIFTAIQLCLNYKILGSDKGGDLG